MTAVLCMYVAIGISACAFKRQSLVLEVLG